VSRKLELRRPRYELALLALVAVAALLPVYPVNAQDVSRLCLTRAIVHGHLSTDECLGNAFDKAAFGGHLYSDKAPGMSVLELPSAEELRLRPIEHLNGLDARLWGVRLLSSGLAFLVCVLLVGRVAEGLAPGCGGAALVAFGLGTLVMPLAAASFEHVTAAALAFGAFLLATRGRSLTAGLLAGGACLVEYQARLIVVALALYLGVRGVRAVAAFAVGVVPGLVLLLAYDALAFGSPWHTPYRYIANGFAFEQSKGLFGIGLPRAYSTFEVFAGGGGLLVVSPVLVAATIGLGLLARTRRAEAVLCGGVALSFAVVNSGYFLPYGGVSPGPRFLIPGLPFLAVGLGPAFAWRPRLTALLTALSIVPMTGLSLIWAMNTSLPRPIWGELARVPIDGSSGRFVRNLGGTALGWLGVGRIWGAAIVALAALAAFALSTRWLWLRPAAADRRPWAPAAVAVLVCVIALADASAVASYPYKYRVAFAPPQLKADISATTTAAAPGQEVDFLVKLDNLATSSTMGVVLWVSIPKGMDLLGRPWFDRGIGCDGNALLTCGFDYQEPSMRS